MHFLLNSFEDAHGCFLPPPGTSPHVVANVLKRFFGTLPEPLLTYKCGLRVPVDQTARTLLKLRRIRRGGSS